MSTRKKSTKNTNDTNPLTSSAQSDRRDSEPVPGLVTVFMNKRAVFGPVVAGVQTFTLGRVPTQGQATGQSLTLDDDSVSREHTDVTLELSGAHVLDRGSRNGTFLGGSLLDKRAFAAYPFVLR